MHTELLVIATVSLSFAQDCPIRVENQRFKDCHGRDLFFHGVNVVYKGWPWHPKTDGFDPQYSLSEYDMQLLQSWGLNSVRLGVMWPGVAPNASIQDNSTYLGLMRAITDDLESHNISTLVDFHQDLFSAKYCGEGAPDWELRLLEGEYALPWPFADPFSGVDNTTGIPTPKQCATLGWGEYQATASASYGYQQLYSNDFGAGTDFDHFWTLVAKAFNTSDAVIGHEIMNEPWAGNWYANPFLMVPGISDRLNLQPMYDRVQRAIRAGDTAHPILFESVTWDDFIPVGFNHTPGGDANVALSFHYYDPPNLNETQHFETRASDCDRLKIAGLLTEFDIGNTPSSSISAHASSSSSAHSTSSSSPTLIRGSTRSKAVASAPSSSLSVSPRLEQRRHRAAITRHVSLALTPRLCEAAHAMVALCEDLLIQGQGQGHESELSLASCQAEVLALHAPQCDATIEKAVRVTDGSEGRPDAGDDQPGSNRNAMHQSSVVQRSPMELHALASLAGVSLPSVAELGGVARQAREQALSEGAAREQAIREVAAREQVTHVGGPLSGITDTVSLADENLVGWIGWEYKPYVPITGWGWGPIQPDGSVNKEEIAVLSRTYAQAVAGTTTSMSFDPATSAFVLQYMPSSAGAGTSTEDGAVDTSAVAAITTVYCNLQLHYPSGIDIAVEPEGALEHTIHVMQPPNANATQYALVDFTPTSGWTAAAAGRVHGSGVTVHITPKVQGVGRVN